MLFSVVILASGPSPCRPDGGNPSEGGAHGAHMVMIGGRTYLIGKFTDPTRTCLRSTCPKSDAGIETIGAAQLAVGRNHFEAALLDP